MAEKVQETRTVVEREVPETSRGSASTNFVAGVVSFIGGLIVALLGIRFVLMLLGANQNNGFVDFIYTASRPFAAPFFGMFNYQERFGVSRFEYETLIAIVVYALITWAIVWLLGMPSRRNTA